MQHEGAATTATIAAYNFVCAQTKAATTRLNAAQTRLESRRVAATICPITYKLKMWNVLQFGASTAMCNARLQHKTRKRELTKKKNRNSAAAAHKKRSTYNGAYETYIFWRVWRVSTSIYANLLPPNELIQNIYLLLCSKIHHKRFKTPSKAAVNEFRIYVYTSIYFFSMSAAARSAFVSWHRTSFTIFTYKVFIIRYL